MGLRITPGTLRGDAERDRHSRENENPSGFGLGPTHNTGPHLRERILPGASAPHDKPELHQKAAGLCANEKPGVEFFAVGQTIGQ